MELNDGLVGQFACTFLYQRQSVPILALFEQNPRQRVGYIGIVRGIFFRFGRQIIGLIELSWLIGGQNGEVVERQNGIWVDSEYLFIGFAGFIKLFLILLY